MTAGRVGVGALALLAAVHILGHRLPADGRTWRRFAAMGLLNNVIPFTLIFWGQTHIDSSLAAILNATTPMFSILIAHFWTADERLTANRLAGIALGIAGVALLVGPGALVRMTEGLWGQVAVLGAALSYALAAVYGRRLREQAPLVNATGQVGANAVMILPVCLFMEQPWTVAPGWQSLAAMIAIGVLSTALAYALYFRILASAGATNLMLVTLLIPLSATVLGVAFLGERPGTTVFAGMALIMVGLVAIDGRIWAARRRPRSDHV